MIYVDSSALVSLHFHDTNTPAALALVAAARKPLLITSLGELEAVNAFYRRVFRKELSPSNVIVAVGDLEADIQSGIFQLHSMPQSAFTRAKALAGTITASIGVRTYDVLHVAAALELGAHTLYTFDRKQREAAQAAGLKVNPLP